MKFPCPKASRLELPAAPTFVQDSLTAADAAGSGLVQAEVATGIVAALAQLGDDGEFH